jgi:chloramphenicol-sensitive protein RarD
MERCWFKYFWLCAIVYADIIDMLYSIVIGLTYAFYLVSQRVNKGFDKVIMLTFHIGACRH